MKQVDILINTYSFAYLLFEDRSEFIWAIYNSDQKTVEKAILQQLGTIDPSDFSRVEDGETALTWFEFFHNFLILLGLSKIMIHQRFASDSLTFHSIWLIEIQNLTIFSIWLALAIFYTWSKFWQESVSYYGMTGRL